MSDHDHPYQRWQTARAAADRAYQNATLHRDAIALDVLLAAIEREYQAALAYVVFRRETWS